MSGAGPSDAAPSRRMPGALLALSPGTLRGGRGFDGILAALERAVDAAVQGGLRSLMLREPFLEDGETLALGLRLSSVLRGAAGGASTWFAIHDRVHLAGELGADGVHLGGRSLPPAEARNVLDGAPVAIGLSAHAGDDPRASEAVDYAFHSPVFPPTSKEKGGGPAVGPSGLRAFAESSPVPVWALGGIDAEAIRSLGNHGGHAGVALIGSLWGTDAVPLGPGRHGPLGDLAGIRGRTEDLAAAAFEVLGSPRETSD